MKVPHSVEVANNLRLPQTKKFSPELLKKSFSTIKWNYQGRITRVVGTLIEASLPNSHIGTIVNIQLANRVSPIIGEVVGFKEKSALILPYNFIHGVAPGCAVTSLSQYTKIPVGDFLLGHVFDAFMEPLTSHPVAIEEGYHLQELDSPAPNPLMRERISSPLALGVKAIDGPLTFGFGQRVGIMAGSGVGKSVLMGMIAKNSTADINVTPPPRRELHPTHRRTGTPCRARRSRSRSQRRRCPRGRWTLSS